MSIPLYPIILDNTIYTSSPEEQIRDGLFDVLFQTGLLKTLADKAYNYDQIGKDSLCYWCEMFFYYDLIDYLILMFDDFRSNLVQCNTEEFNLKFSEYKLNCIKKTLLCRFGTSNVLDEIKNKLVELFVQRLELCCTNGEGISLMQINSPICSTFIVYPAS